MSHAKARRSRRVLVLPYGILGNGKVLPYGILGNGKVLPYGMLGNGKQWVVACKVFWLFGL